LFDWLDELDGETAGLIYEAMRERVGLWYWKRI